MHDHETMTLVAGTGISQMTVMWILMGLMAIHHVFMWRKMRRRKCTCKRK